MQHRKYRLYDESMLPATNFGFTNTGADCWCNSVIQTLLSLPALSNVLFGCEETFTNNEFACEYIALLNNTIKNKSLAWEKKAVSRRILLAIHKQNSDRFNDISYKQQCAQEMFTIFQEAFQSQLSEEVYTNIYEVSKICNKCNRLESKNIDRTYQIILPANIATNDTEEEFTNWIMARYDEINDFKCTKCLQLNAKDISIVKMLSEVIIIVFLKYEEKYLRWFPLNMTFPSINDTKLRYKLVSKIEHAGSAKSGHYWCHALRKGIWKKFDDEIVSGGDSKPTTETVVVVYHLDKVIT